MKKIELGKTVVQILWEDAWTDPSYFTLETIAKEGPYTCTSVGVCLRNNKAGISICRERFADDKFRNIQHIPRAMIRKVEILRTSK